jgi:predicted anti-sigma-YlaC factor YlaD
MTAPECTAARTWFSGARDGEAPQDEHLDHHLATCPNCTRWATAFDQINRNVRLRSPRPTLAARNQILAAARTNPLPARDRLTTAILAVAAVGMVVAFGLAIAGVFGHSHLGTAEGRDSEALMISLAGGYALAAWRPTRLAVGLLPVALLAGLVTVVTSIIALSAGTTTLVSEITHLPLLLGAFGTVRAARPAIAGVLRAPSEADETELAHA